MMFFDNDFYGIAVPILAQIFAVIGLIYLHSIDKKDKEFSIGKLRKISERFSSKNGEGRGI